MKYIGDDIKAVIFDHDDTLVGTIEAKWAQHKHVAKTHYNRELLDEDLREHWGKPLRELLGLLYQTEDADKALELVMAIHEDFPKKLFESTIGVLEKLRERNLLVGVVTGTQRFSLEYDIDNLGIPRNLFDYTQTEDETPFHKPDSRVFDPLISWLAGHKVKPSEVIYVGDNYVDMKAANAAGFGFIGVCTGIVSKSEFAKHKAMAVSSLQELLK